MFEYDYGSFLQFFILFLLFSTENDAYMRKQKTIKKLLKSLQWLLDTIGD